MADSNSTFVYVTGPVHVFVRAQAQGPNPSNQSGVGGGVLLYLGTTQLCPEFDRGKQWRPVWAAPGGDAVPFDQRYGGQLISIGLDLVKHSDTVLQMVEDCPNFGRSGSFDGHEELGDRGQLLMQGKKSLEVWLVNTFAQWGAENLAQFPDLRLGYYFFACKTDRVYRGRDGLPESMVRVDLTAEALPNVRRMGFDYFSSDPSHFTNIPFPI